MRIAQINDFYGSSTGMVMNSIAQYGWLQGEAIYTFAPPEEDGMSDFPGHYYVGTAADRKEHQRIAERSGRNGFYSVDATKRMLEIFDELNIQLIHLHNIHAFSFNLPLLFNYINDRKLPVVWTLHGCWPFTGKCGHFTIAKCGKWEQKEGCHDCPQLNVWPWSLETDNSSFMYQWKKEHFCRIENMTIAAPSHWMGDLARRSFLGKYPVEVIHNGINTWRFCPTESNFREKYHLQDKIILLGVAAGWGYRKGLDTMCRLSERLDSRYQVVIVGKTDGSGNSVPDSLLSLPYEYRPVELAKIFTAADFFINPTREENYPTVNMEALACGTPVITYDTGGSPEIPDESCGRVVPCDDLEELIRVIEEESQSRRLTKEACLKRARQFGQDTMCEAYLDLYRRMLETTSRNT